MNNELLALQPEKLWFYFTEILKIPRPSKKEEKIIAFLLDFGKNNQLETIQDEVGNVLIRKDATPGFENKKTVVLQSHIDMVCEKNNDTVFDFENDPIQAYIEDGWVKANGTTLGADDGIGVAAQLAILASDDIAHGPIECLFTVDEETGLTGAFGLKPGFLKGDILLNLDSEDDGELFIGCAGGKDTVIKMGVTKDPVDKGLTSWKITVNGLVGGHSGDDIQKGRANANKLLNRLLFDLLKIDGFRLADFNGGNLRNAIARESYAVVCLPEDKSKSLHHLVESAQSIFRSEYKTTEPDVKISIEQTNNPDFVVDRYDTQKLIHSLYACPHGVIAWSQEIPNFVETSTNLASVKLLNDHFLITTSQRSSVESAKDDIANAVASTFLLTGADVEHTDGYPGWTPNPHSAIVDITAKLYNELFNEIPKVLAIHAGLECGLIGDVYPEMDMISYGPTIKGAHSPDERLKIDTVFKFWQLTLEVLKMVPEK